MRSKLRISALLSVLLLVAAATLPAADRLDAGRLASPRLLIFSARNCPPCVQFVIDASNPEFANWLRSHNAITIGENRPDLVKSYGVTIYPSFCWEGDNEIWQGYSRDTAEKMCRSLEARKTFLRSPQPYIRANPTAPAVTGAIHIEINDILAPQPQNQNTPPAAAPPAATQVPVPTFAPASSPAPSSALPPLAALPDTTPTPGPRSSAGGSQTLPAAATAADPDTSQAPPDWSLVKVVFLVRDVRPGKGGWVDALLGAAERYADEQDGLANAARRAVNDHSGGKADFEVVFERVHPARFRALLKLAGGVPDASALVLVRSQFSGPLSLVESIGVKLAEKLLSKSGKKTSFELILQAKAPGDFKAAEDALELSDETEPETPPERWILYALGLIGSLIWGRKRAKAGFDAHLEEIARDRAAGAAATASRAAPAASATDRIAPPAPPGAAA